MTTHLKDRTKAGTLLICILLAVFATAALASDPSTPSDPASDSAGTAATGAVEDAVDFLQFYRLARENDPSFQGQKYRHEASPETLKQAYAGALPVVKADLYFMQSRQEIKQTDVAVYGEKLAKYPSRGFTLTLTQPVLDTYTFERIDQAKEEVKQADLEFSAAEQDLILRASDAYINALEAFDARVFTSAKGTAVARTFELAEERFNSGLTPITDYHDAKARLASVVADEVLAENELDDSLEALVELTDQRIGNIARLKYAPPSEGTGQEPEGGGIPMVNPDPNDVDAWVKAALENNFEIKIRKQSVLIAEQEIKRQVGRHNPTVAFVGRFDKDYQGGSLYGGESHIERTDVMFQISLPLYEGMTVTSSVREARKLNAATKKDLEKEIRVVKRETRAAFLGVKSAIKNAEALGQSVVSNQIALEAKREGFKSGLFPSLVILDAERDLHFAKTEFANAHYEYIRNSLRLKKAVGTLNEEDIEGINQWLK